jgi:hypothetical protein
MANAQSLVPSQHHQNAHGKSLISKRKILILITCLGSVAVISSQYTAHSRATLRPINPPIHKDDFIVDSIVDYRRSGFDGKDEQRNGVLNDDGDPGLEYSGTPLHVVFSTSCHDQMNWESFVFFYHAWKVKQPGTVTRIASGCNDEEAEKLTDFHETSIKTMSDRFYLHLTPDFSKQRLKEKFSYKYMNKPFGLRSWMEVVLQMNSTSRSKGVEDGVVILMDPDMVLLRPLLHDFSKEDVIWVEEEPRFTMVKHGHPIAQQDGYLDSKWMKINGTFITGDPNIGRPKDTEGPIHWNTGPPYLATVKDMYDIARLWTEYAPRV